METVVETTPTKYKDRGDHAKHLFWYGRKSKRCFTVDETFESLKEQIRTFYFSPCTHAEKGFIKSHYPK